MNMKLKPIYFLLLFIVFFFILYYLDKKDADTYIRSKENKNISIKDTLKDVDEVFLIDSLPQKDLCFILFYVKDSDTCNMMATRLETLISETKDDCFYKINANQYPRLIYKYNISGVPSIIIFKKGIDSKRIMGIVPYSNLKMIYEREKKMI